MYRKELIDAFVDAASKDQANIAMIHYGRLTIPEQRIANLYYKKILIERDIEKYIDEAKKSNST
jgi:hypothetical protein